LLDGDVAVLGIAHIRVDSFLVVASSYNTALLNVVHGFVRGVVRDVIRGCSGYIAAPEIGRMVASSRPFLDV
jgi:hypothetical protein